MELVAVVELALLEEAVDVDLQVKDQVEQD